MKLFLSILLSTSLLFSDSIFNGYCVQDDWYVENGRIYYKLSDNTSYTSSRFNSNEFNIIETTKFNYIYDTNTGTCSQIPNTMGLTYKEFNYLMALWGLLLSIAVFISFSLVI